jgi:hypothetical protein
VVSGTEYEVQPMDSVILIKTAITSVFLPSATDWLLAQQANGQVKNLAPFMRNLWIKDLLGNASVATPITVYPAAGDLIDGFTEYAIATPNELLRLWPLTTTEPGATGWYQG